MVKDFTRVLVVLCTLVAASHTYAEEWPDLSVGVKNGERNALTSVSLLKIEDDQVSVVE